jgi:hypothetical protein
MLKKKERKLFVGMTLLSIVVLTICSAELFAQPKVSGYIQNTMIKTENDKAFVFGFDRVRIRLAGKLNEIMKYKLQVDFTKSAKAIGNDGSTPGMINYAELIFNVYKTVNLSVGKFKTPLGMEWNTGPHSLDFVKRGLGQAFVFHFDAGAMLHAANIGKPGFGFAAGIFNFGPNKANDVGDPAQGQDYTLVGRISLDPHKKFHAEVFGGSALTSIEEQKNVNLYGAGVKAKLFGKLQLKGELLSREDAQNSSSDGTNYYIQAGYQIHPKFEPTVKYENLDVTYDAKDQGNLTLGLNIFLNPEVKKQSKIQVNYVSSDLDGKDAIQFLYQATF